MPESAFSFRVVALGDYDQSVERPFASLSPSAYEDAQAVSAVLADRLGARASSGSATDGVARDRDWVDSELRAWADRTEGASGSMLVWIGHGESDGETAWLALPRSSQGRPSSGLGPEVLAAFVREEWLERQDDDGSWSIIVVQACEADRFIDLLSAAIVSKGNPPRRIALVSAGGEGQSFLNTFRRALTATLDSYGENDDAIRLGDFLSRLDEYLQRLGSGRAFGSMGVARPIPRPRTWNATIAAPEDVVAELKEFIEQLDDDQKAHFLPKAQGGEQGEPAWYFEGRAAEREGISSWLEEYDTGILIITGPPGCGKSALLGNVQVYANSRLRALLIAAGRIKPLPAVEQPADDVFDVVMTLTGLTAADVVSRIGAALGVPLDPGIDLGARIDALISVLKERLFNGLGVFTVLLDALDEAQDPLGIAGGVIRRIGLTAGVRVVVGTRRSTMEGPDLPDPPDSDILTALMAEHFASVLPVPPDPEAVARYVRGRLTTAREHGSIPFEATDEQIAEVSGQIADRSHPFLFARLAVHEIVAHSEMLTTDRVELDRLIGGGYADLFAHAVGRLRIQDRTFEPLLRALAFAQGRGLPRGDGVWVTVARALTGDESIGGPDVEALRHAAAPFIMIDGEGGESVYRLSHRTFQEHLRAHREGMVLGTGDAVAEARAVAGRLLGLAHEQLLLEGRVMPYFRRHLPGFVAEGQAWDALNEMTDVLDAVDLEVLSTEVLRSLLGFADVPPQIAAAVVNLPQVRSGHPHARARQRDLGHARLFGGVIGPGRRAEAGLGLEWAEQVRPAGFSVTLGDQLGSAEPVSFPDPAGRPLVVTADWAGVVRIWDAATGLAVGAPMIIDGRAIVGLTPITLDADRRLLAGVDEIGNLVVWDADRTEVIAQTFVSAPKQLDLVNLDPRDPGFFEMFAMQGLDAPPIGALTAVRLADGGTALVTASALGQLGIWQFEPEPVPWRELRPITPGRSYPGPELVTTVAPSGRPFVGFQSTTSDAFWFDPTGPASREADPELPTAARFAATSDGGLLLGKRVDDGWIDLHDPADGTFVGRAGEWGLRNVLRLPDGRLRAVRGDEHGSVFTDVVDGTWAGGLSDLMGRAVLLTDSTGRVLVGGRGRDDVFRLWNWKRMEREDATARDVAAAAIHAVPQATGGTLLAVVDYSDEVVVRDPALGIVGESYPAPPFLLSAAAEPAPLRVRIVRSAAEALLVRKAPSGDLALWDLGLSGPGESIDPTYLLESTAGVRDLEGPARLSATQRAVAGIGGSDVRIWTLSAGRCMPRILSMGDAASIAWIRGDRGEVLLATADSEGGAQVWDPVSARRVGHYRRPRSSRWRSEAIASFGAPGQMMLAVSTADRVRIWSLRSRRLIAELDDARDVLGVVTVDEGREALAYGSWWELRVWDPVSRTTTVRFPMGVAASAITGIRGADGRPLVAIGCVDGSVRIWDPVSRAEVDVVRLNGANARVWPAGPGRLTGTTAEGVASLFVT